VRAIALGAALGTGLMAGLFFAFSVSVMRALASRPAAEGIAAMQAISRAILNPVFLVVFFNVPRNNALARASAGDPESARLWADYLATWTAWNHVRTAASLAALALLIIGLS
jgi:uncharacterized membrane protein